MKALNLNLTLFFIAAIIALASSPKTSAHTADSLIYENDSVFTIESIQNELNDDGEWIKVNKDEVDPDGVTDGEREADDDINTDYVWRPHNVDPDWSPYTNGYWIYTNCGWMWVSYYQWGWRTCHYGRWWWSAEWGWVWSPGFIWAPAWVVWMYNDGYCGWYPISPWVRWNRHHGWYCHNMRFHVRHWTFCNNNNFTVHINHEVIVDPPHNKEIIDKAKFVSDINVDKGKVINKGPDLTTIEKAGGEKIKTKDVTKYNNAKVVTEKKNDIEKKTNYEGKEKQNTSEKKTNGNGNNEKKQNNDQGQKNNDGQKNNEKKSNNNDKQNNNEKKSNNNDKQNNNEKKSNDNGKINKEYKYSPPKDKGNYEKKSDWPPKGQDAYKKEEKKEEAPPPPPPVKKDEGNNNSDKNDNQSEKKR